MEQVEISSAKELSRINSDEEKEFILTDDIDLAVLEKEYNIVQKFLREYFGFHVSFPIEEINGIFNGQGHTIKNFKIDRFQENDVGFVKENNGVIKNLNIEGLEIQASSSVGGVAVRNNGVIRGCSVSGSIEGFSQDVFNNEGDGGICTVNNGKIINCEVEDTMINSEAGVGEIAGINKNTIKRCSSYGTALAKVQCGGLVGINKGKIKGCNSDMDVNAEECVGGLVGRNSTSSSSIRDSYFTGGVLSEGIGGILVALNLNGKVKNCFWEKERVELEPIGTGMGEIEDIGKVEKGEDIEQRILLGKI